MPWPDISETGILPKVLAQWCWIFWSGETFRNFDSERNLVVYECGDHFYHLCATVYDKGRISGIYSCGCCGISTDNFPEVMGITGIYAFLPVFLMGMCVAKYDLFNRWFKIWNAGMKHVFKFLLELLAVFILYKAYRTLPLTVYSEIHWGVYPIVFMAFCCEFINVIPGVRQILLFLGKHSMNIFLIHTFIRKYSFVYVSGYFLTNTLTLCWLHWQCP